MNFRNRNRFRRRQSLTILPVQTPATSSRRATYFKDILGLVKDIVLVLAGGLIGVFANQYFYRQNKLMDAKIEFSKEQLPNYARIIDFTDAYTHQVLTWTNRNDSIATYWGYDGKAIKEDTVRTKIDTVRFDLPSFISTPELQAEMMDDISEIKKNKNKIDVVVWRRFHDVNLFLLNHPVPRERNFKEYQNSDWTKKATIEEWKKLMDELKAAAERKMNEMDVKSMF